MKKYLSDQKGMVLVLSLSIMTLLFFLTTMFLWISDTERNISVNQRDATQAFYLAEAGLQHGIGYLNHENGAWRTPTDPELTATFTNGSYSVTCIDDPAVPGGTIVTSTGQIGYVKEITKAAVTLSAKPTHSGFANGNMDLTTASGAITGDTVGEQLAIHTNGVVLQATPPGVTITGTVTEAGGDPPDESQPMKQVSLESYKIAPDVIIYNSDQIFTSSDKNTISGNIIYVEGQVTLNAGSKNIDFNNCCIIAEGDIILEGSKKISLTSLDDYALLVTKTGDITESGSDIAADRSLNGYIVTEGNITFENLSMQGALVGNLVTITENIDLKYKPNQLPDNPYGIIGGGSVTKWRETY